MVGVFRKPYVYAGVALVAVSGWAFLTVGDAIVNGHPSYLLLYGGAAVLGLTAIALALVGRSSRTRVWLTAVGTAGLVVLAGLAWWLAPFEATDRALLALKSDDTVAVSSSASVITLTPVDGQPSVGVVFQPGARVDARAYAGILRPIAEAGHQVVIVKQPLGIAFLASGVAPRWAADHPEINRWVVAGHSLGGVVAADNAAARNAVNDLVLWASFPATDISKAEFGALSVFGTADGLTTTDRIERSKGDLPPETRFEPVNGAVHSYFGDYGPQPGDGDPGITRDEAQDLIVGATLAFLAR